MANTIICREDRRRQQDQWLTATENGLKSREIALALGESIRTVQWGIAAAKRRRDRAPSLPKLQPIFGPDPWHPDIHKYRVVEGGRAQCRLCGSLQPWKRQPVVSTIRAHSIVCAACHAVSPANQRKIDAALNRQDVSDSSREINFKATAPAKHRRKAKVS